MKDLFHLLNNSDNPEQTTGEDLAVVAFKEMDIDLDGQVTQVELNLNSLSKKPWYSRE